VKNYNLRRRPKLMCLSIEHSAQIRDTLLTEKCQKLFWQCCLRVQKCALLKLSIGPKLYEDRFYGELRELGYLRLVFKNLIVKKLIKKFQKTWGRIPQHLTQSVYAHRSQKCKNDSQVISLFGAFGIYGRKSCSENVDEIDPWSMF